MESFCSNREYESPLGQDKCWGCFTLEGTVLRDLVVSITMGIKHMEFFDSFSQTMKA
jgi:hypothetical protein